jgi:hypothetical protein
MTGLDNFLYMRSESSSSGSVTINLTFDTGTNPDIAQVQVQNKLQQAMALLPQTVQQEGVQVNKSNSTFLMVVGLISSDGIDDQFRPRRLHGHLPARSPEPHPGCRLHPDLRQPVCHAHLAGSQ